MEKKDNQHEILKVALRLLLALILGAAISFLFVYLLFKDNDDIIELLFSEKLNPLFFTLIIVTWLFGAIMGALISAMEFINALVEKKLELEEATKEIHALRTLLGKIDKKYAKSPASRMFEEIKDVSGSSANKGDVNFTTLQEQLKAKSTSSKK